MPFGMPPFEKLQSHAGDYRVIVQIKDRTSGRAVSTTAMLSIGHNNPEAFLAPTLISNDGPASTRRQRRLRGN